jgi:hypothetical protein
VTRSPPPPLAAGGPALACGGIVIPAHPSLSIEVPMKAYVITTGAVFALIVIAHVLRMALENPRLATDPAFLALTGIAVGFCAWAVVLLRRGVPVAPR